MGDKKTTPDIHDALLDRAKRHAKKIVRPLRAVVEDGLRQVLAVPISPYVGMSRAKSMLIVVAQANVCEDLKSSVGATDQEDS